MQYKNLQTWLRKHKEKAPSKSSTDPEEKALADFVNRKRSNLMTNSCGRAEKEKLMQLPGLLFRKKEVNWEKSFAAVQDWLSKHNGKYPSQTAANAKEKRLGKWVENQCARFNALKAPRKKRVALEMDSSTSARRQKLEELPGFEFQKRQAGWEKSCSELEEWMSTHDRKFPSEKANDAREKKLARWVRKQRRRLNALKAAQRQRLQKIDARKFSKSFRQKSGTAAASANQRKGKRRCAVTKLLKRPSRAKGSSSM